MHHHACDHKSGLEARCVTASDVQLTKLSQGMNSCGLVCTVTASTQEFDPWECAVKLRDKTTRRQTGTKQVTFLHACKRLEVTPHGALGVSRSPSTRALAYCTPHELYRTSPHLAIDCIPFTTVHFQSITRYCVALLGLWRIIIYVILIFRTVTRFQRVAAHDLSQLFVPRRVRAVAT